MKLIKRLLWNLFMKPITPKGCGAFLLAFWGGTFLLFLTEYWYIQVLWKKLPEGVEEQRFLQWSSKYENKITYSLNDFRRKKRSFVEIEFKNMELSYEDVEQVLLQLPVESYVLEEVVISAKALLLLLDNPYVDRISFRQGDTFLEFTCLQDPAEDFWKDKDFIENFDSSLKSSEAWKKYILYLCPNPDDDFLVNPTKSME